MTDDVTASLPLDAFIAALADALGLDGTGWTGATRLVEDAGLDSLDAYEVLCTIEVWADCAFEDELVVTWQTFDDLHRCYANNFTRATGPTGPFGADRPLLNREHRDPGAARPIN